MRSLPSWLTAGVAGAAFLAPALAAHAEPYRFHYDHVLGTSLDVTVMARDEASALAALTAAKTEIVRLDALLSAWRPEAELARLNQADEAKVSPELYAVLTRCEGWRRATGGAFDCRMGGPLKLWREAETIGGGVDAQTLQGALAAAHADIGFDPAERRIRRPEGVLFTVDGMAKGYVIDAALNAARRASPGVSGVMIDVGGDLRCWGRAPEAAGWRVGVAAVGDADNALPAQVLRVSDKAVAFSGRGQRDLTVQGCAVSHTLTPDNGQPVAAVTRAVVVAPSAADADALATAFMAMAPHDAMALANRLEGVEALVSGADGRNYASNAWTAAVEDAPRPIPASLAMPMTGAAGAAAAAQGFTLDFAYNVPKLDADPYHAPYVVAWITDTNHKLVRTLLILGQKPRYVTENYVWWRRYGRETPQVVDTLAKPTRMPGRYAAHWDGKDEAGQPVAPGHYIFHIEASREKGGHTYETVDIDVGGPMVMKTATPKDELGALELRYGPAK
jgi:thiamine biosynthesis lipoprotein